MFVAKVYQITQLNNSLKVAMWCVCSPINEPALEPVDERFVNRTRDLHHIFMWSAEHHDNMDVCRPNVGGQFVTWLKKPAKKPFLVEEWKVLDSLAATACLCCISPFCGPSTWYQVFAIKAVCLCVSSSCLLYSSLQNLCDMTVEQPRTALD